MFVINRVALEIVIFFDELSRWIKSTALSKVTWEDREFINILVVPQTSRGGLVAYVLPDEREEPS